MRCFEHRGSPYSMWRWSPPRISRTCLLKQIATGNKKILVPFKLKDSTMARRNPYNMSREEEIWLKSESQNMFSWHSTVISVHVRLANHAGPKRRWIFETTYRLPSLESPNRPISLFYSKHRNNWKTGGWKVFSRINLCKQFSQVPLEQEYKTYTAFVTPFGVHEYNRLPFG